MFLCQVPESKQILQWHIDQPCAVDSVNNTVQIWIVSVFFFFITVTTSAMMNKTKCDCNSNVSIVFTLISKAISVKKPFRYSEQDWLQ